MSGRAKTRLRSKIRSPVHWGCSSRPRISSPSVTVWTRLKDRSVSAFSVVGITWNVDTAANTLTLSATRNLQRLSVDSSRAGLSTTVPYSLQLSSSDATGDTVVFEDVAHAPSSVRRDGVPAPSTYDAATHTLTLVETNASTHLWVVTP